MNLLKKLAQDWKAEAKGPTLSIRKHVAEAYMRCATELDSMLNAVEALAKFKQGNGCGLPFSTVAWVVADGRRYIREWHPMAPSSDGTPQGNWWPLEGGMEGRFSEHEISHYSVIEVPDLPEGMAPSPVPNRRRTPPEGGPVELQAFVGKSMQTGQYVAFTVLADLRAGQPVVVEVAAATEVEALHELQIRADAVLRTFFHHYKTVRL